MVNKFVDGLTIALGKQFGTTYNYYVEDIEQNLKKPCFVVKILNPLIRSVNSRKYYRTIPITIHYFTNKTNTIDGRKDCYSISERIMEAVEYITVDDCLFRGEDIEWEIVDGVLQFFITYNFEVVKEIEDIYIEDGTFNGVPL